MTLMTFDSEPASPAPRIRLLHTHRGHILGVRVPGKPYPVLPSAPLVWWRGMPHNSAEAARISLRALRGLTSAITEQTGLFFYPADDVGTWAYPEFFGDGQDDLFEPDGSMLYRGGLTLAGGVLRPQAGFFHPSEWRSSIDAERVRCLSSDVEPLKYEQVSLYPHEVSPGDRYLFPIVGTRYERTIDGDEGVSFCYESYAEVALGRDDSFASDDAADDESEGRPKRGVVERDPRLGRVWGSPHKLNARLLVQRLGGDFRGPST